MAVDVVTEIVIERPPEVVAAYASNPDHAPAWYVNIQSAKWLTEKPLQAGTQVAFTAKFMGKALAYTYEFVVCTPHQLVMQTQAPFPMQTTYTWQATPNGHTRMALRNMGHPKGFSKLLAPLMASAMRRANKKDLKALKAILEGR